MNDNLFQGNIAREKMMAGVAKVAQAVGETMGTGGANSLLETIERPFHFPTNDGYQIANAIKLADPLEEMGRLILCEAINRANRASGDGSSTTCVLTAAILEEGITHLKEASPMEIKRSLEDCIPIIEKSLNKQKKEIDIDNVADVATIAAEDEVIGNRIQEIYQKIGKKGIIQWDTSKTTEDSYLLGTGITISGATYASPYMCDIDQAGNLSQLVKWENVNVLLCRQKISSAIDFENLFTTLFSKNIREIAIFCDDIEVPVIADLIRTRAMRQFKSVVIKMPVLWNEEWWKDLELASGAKIVDFASGLTLKNATEEHLGHFDHLTVTKEDTYIDGIKDLTHHIKALEAEASDESLQRSARLNIKTARYLVGGHSEAAVGQRRMKVEDAINSASCALDNGIVAGGGVALLNVTKNLPKNKIGGIILKAALLEPAFQIALNSGLDSGILNKIGGKKGFDSRNGKIVNMFKSGIVDATDVVLNACKNAIGVAATILTINSVITFPKQDEPRRI